METVEWLWNDIFIIFFSDKGKKPYSGQAYVEDTVVWFWLGKCLTFSKAFHKHFGREPENENKQFKETKTWISNLYRQVF